MEAHENHDVETREEEKRLVSKHPESIPAGNLSGPELGAQAKKSKKKRKGKKSTKIKSSNNAAIPAFPPTTSSPAAGGQPNQNSFQDVSEMNREQPRNIFTDEGRLATCQSIIEATQRKILYLRREQLNDIYTEFKQLCEISWGVTKGAMTRLLCGYRDPARAITLYKYISEFPSQIPTPGLPKTIEILTKSVREVLLIFLDVVTAFDSYGESSPRERALVHKGNEMMMKFYTGKEAD
ncbi:hypothetical protein N431DRAFT_526634 [Stipitochalara longipes BDJ]|nr:hypothetical protein N431DRAFT_526634 [Stipitochalara longipes BDJ]